MKILYVHQHFSTPKGKTGIRSYQFSRCLAEKGHEVTMLCGSYAAAHTGLEGDFKLGFRQGLVNGIKVIEIKLDYSNHMRFWSRIWVFLKFSIITSFLALILRYDIIVATSTPLSIGMPGLVARYIRRKRFVLEIRDLWPSLPRALGIISNPLAIWSLEAFEALLYRSSSSCIALAPGIAEGMLNNKTPPSKLVVIPNGCDIELFNVRGAQNTIDSTLQNKKFVLYSGTHGFANGLDILIETARLLADLGKSNINIVLIGDGKEKQKLMKNSLEDHRTNIIFMEPKDKPNLVPIMHNAVAGLQLLRNVPDFYNGTSPNKFFDYIACGLPVIINYPGWLSDVVKSNNCGWVAQPENPNSLAASIIAAVENPNERNLKASNAKTLAEKKFNRSELSEKWVDWVIRS